MENRVRRNLAAGVVSPLLLLLAWLVAAEPLLAAPPNSAVSSSPLPLVFEENRGQADPRVKFLARGSEYALFVTPTEAVLADRQTGHVVHVRLLGARQDAEVTGLEPLPGRVHYIRGRDPATRRTGVPTYARVAYREAYTGIDAVYKTATGSRFEQEFLVRPDADPSVIRLQFGGVQSLVVDAAGDLVLAIEKGQMRLDRPVAYQELNGVRHMVSAAWVTLGSNEAGFRLGSYDRSRTLVIDPVITWATYLGGSGTDQAFGIAVDSAGNSYVTGDTSSFDFPTTDASHAISTDVFVTKLNATGQTLVYSVRIGGGGTDGGRGIAVDPSGNAYVAGFTTSTDFPITPGAFQSQHGGGCAFTDCEFLDAFVLKLDPSGTLLYATYLGGKDADVALGIAVDAAGRAHVAGGTRSSNFPVANALQPLHGGGAAPCPVEVFDPIDGGFFLIPCPRAAFVTRLSPQGIVEYSTFLGGSSEDVANAIALDDTGNAYVTGSSAGGFPTTPQSLQPNFGGDVGPTGDAFVARIDANTALGWATYLGGSGQDVGRGIAVDSMRRPHVVGNTSSDNFPATGGDRFTGIHGLMGFVVQMAADGDAIVWSRNTASHAPAGVALDAKGQIHVVGTSVAVVDTRAVTGERLSLFSFGGTPAFGSAITANGSSLWVAGSTLSNNFPTTPGTFQPSAPGGLSAFVVRLGEGSAASGASDADGDGSDGKCLIATAAFGSPLVWEVTTLRRFRDRALLTHALGRLFVRAYYRLSPPLAHAVASQPLLAAGVRALLGPIAFGADFAMDRPAVATALAGVGLAAMVGLAVRRGKNARRIRAAALMCLLLGGLLLVVVFALGSRQTTSPSLISTAPVDRSMKAQRAPVVPGTPAASGRSSTAQAALDFTNLVSGRVSVTPLNPFASRGERRFSVTSELIEGILSAKGFLVTDPRRARAFGIEAGDTIVRVNGYPPTGLVAAITTLQRDPDRAAVVLEIDRGGTRLVQSHRVRQRLPR
jgi:Beta-propeller repeat